MESNSFLVDANVYIGLYRGDDSQHQEALSIFEELREKQIILPYCIVQEVCTVLTNKAGKATADIFLENIMNVKNIEIIDSNVSKEMAHFRSVPEALSFADITLIYLSKIWKAELITFDKQLLKLYKKTNSR